MSKYVQHVSGQGERWELSDAEYNHDPSISDWHVKGKNGSHFLPKSEFRECEPPEIWRDVTEHCETGSVGFAPNDTHLFIKNKDGSSSRLARLDNFTYRLRKVRVTLLETALDHLNAQWAFLVEKKEG